MDRPDPGQLIWAFCIVRPIGDRLEHSYLDRIRADKVRNEEVGYEGYLKIRSNFRRARIAVAGPLVWAIIGADAVAEWRRARRRRRREAGVEAL